MESRGEALEMMRLILCAGLIVLGYYVGQQSCQRDLTQDETSGEEQDQEDA